MSNNTQPPSQRESWAAPVSRLTVSELQGKAVNLNVEGRRVTGPVQGFGQLWQKTYTIHLTGAKVTPQELIQGWKDNFASFWPEHNQFYGRPESIAPGQVAVLNLAGPGGMTSPGGGPLISTGILVIYADDESFSFITPEGHMFAGMITFSSYQEGDTVAQDGDTVAQDGDTVAQIQALIRASDPIYEMMFRMGLGHKMEDTFWFQTLRNLATHFQAPGCEPTLKMVLVDPRIQWREARNVWHNAAIRTGIYTIGAPVRWARRLFKG
jgi:hypothetical protein